ncbi:uncharacterized protein LY79DRAFT_595302 [Colletotrichum navitas]|uniref:Uncharacterized protein n=1 Tax=Colletotrichum navitas TaxID=681940 RepID=A0AAD8UY54_9PEZI|nr:uncharacterized protein LY79DRAFT_595302 [Colletotrichum navitas]KAK1564176.1 hypothetical protein LY79DRAFT_595302 [Colletotrichum navitas]
MLYTCAARCLDRVEETPANRPPIDYCYLRCNTYCLSYPQRPAHRFEIVTLPLPQSFSDDERVDACIRHHEKEIQSRLPIADKAKATSRFLPERIVDRRYARRILVLNRFEANEDSNNDGKTWNGGKMHPDANRFGSYLDVEWQRRKKHDFVGLGPEYTPRDVSFHSCGVEQFGSTLFEMFLPAAPFYNHFVPDGVLNRQLLDTRRSLADVDALTI